MALSNTTADSLATAIASALGVSDSASIAKYKQIYRLVYSHLLTDVVIRIAANAIPVTTTGSATNQSGAGPLVNVDISPQ